MTNFLILNLNPTLNLIKFGQTLQRQPIDPKKSRQIVVIHKVILSKNKINQKVTHGNTTIKQK